ncbi:hypothetical protein [Leifsonia sp. NCR5]|uniref:hypothetical protein n=1 Tax=Leifsonia sp. NCR5 TaxID=1978342 RepID=UPI00117A671A|nr:hypothetical protein [Leifsonia sp. NCR5]
MLANPAFAPRRPSHSSGAYFLLREDRDRTVLVPRDSSAAPVVELVSTGSRIEGRRQFDAGALDIGWGVGVPPQFWTREDPGPFARSPELDMHVIVAAGRTVSPDSAREILDSCALARGLPAGIDATSTRFAGERNAPAQARPVAIDDEWPLFFSEFPPNREIANSLARASNGRLIPTRVSYGALVDGSLRQHGFSLEIHATQFPDALGMLVETALIEGTSLPVSGDLREAASQIWGTENESSRREMARSVEQHLDTILRRRVIGRMRSRFRSHSDLKIPRTGWLDFRQFTTFEGVMHESRQSH